MGTFLGRREEAEYCEYDELGNQLYSLIIVPCTCFDVSFDIQHRASGNLVDRGGEVVGMTFLGRLHVCFARTLL